MPNNHEELKARLIEISSALLEGAKGKLNITNLNKAIFYMDLYCLRDFGATLSTSPFIALKQGPVVAKYETRLIKPLKDAGIATQVTEGPALPIVLNRSASRHFLNDDKKLDLARELGHIFSGVSAGTASDFSHENLGWKIAYRDGAQNLGKPLSINMNIALQQIIDADPWMQQPLTEKERESLKSADKGEGKAW